MFDKPDLTDVAEKMWNAYAAIRLAESPAGEIASCRKAFYAGIGSVMTALQTSAPWGPEETGRVLTALSTAADRVINP